VQNILSQQVGVLMNLLSTELRFSEQPLLVAFAFQFDIFVQGALGFQPKLVAAAFVKHVSSF
jgi:hypothetical protein